jgi:hypothetical protein
VYAVLSEKKKEEIILTIPTKGGTSMNIDKIFEGNEL